MQLRSASLGGVECAIDERANRRGGKMVRLRHCVTIREAKSECSHTNM
jgi:hypothetical protein